MLPILITGATGHIGGHLTEQLAAHGYPLRALVRSREKAAGLPMGVEPVVGDMARPETLSAALDGVERVFLLDPSYGPDFIRNMLTASNQAGVRLIVYLSSLGVGLDPLPIFYRLFSAREAAIKDSGIGWTFLRPSQFMSNALRWQPSIRAEGVVVDPIGPGRLASIDPADIAAVAATALIQEGHAGQIYTLTGNELLTTKQQVEILADVLSRPIKYVEITPEEAAQDMLAKGMAPASVTAMKDSYERVRADAMAFMTDDVERVTGQKPGSFESWCRRNAAAFG